MHAENQGSGEVRSADCSEWVEWFRAQYKLTKRAQTLSDDHPEVKEKLRAIHGTLFRRMHQIVDDIGRACTAEGREAMDHAENQGVTEAPIFIEPQTEAQQQRALQDDAEATARETDGVTLSAHGKPMDEFSTALHRFADSIPGVPRDHGVSHDCIATRLREVFRMAFSNPELFDAD